MANQSSFECVNRLVPGLKASTSLTTKQYCFVKISGDLTVAVAGDDEQPIGVLCNKPDSGQAAVVAGPGSVTKLLLGDTVTVGQAVGPKSDGSGSAQAVSEADDPAYARVLLGGASGDVVPAVILGGLTVTATP